MAHQGQLISAINQYCKNKFGPGEYLGEGGVCNGISGYVLLKHAAGEIDKFTQFVSDFYNGDVPSWQVRQFVEEVKLLQNFSGLLAGIPVQQSDYHHVFNFLLSPTNSNDPIDILSPPEEHKKSSRKFDFGLLMTRDEMASVLAQILKPG